MSEVDKIYNTMLEEVAAERAALKQKLATLREQFDVIPTEMGTFEIWYSHQGRVRKWFEKAREILEGDDV